MTGPEIGGDGHLEGEPAEGWQAARDGPPNTLDGAVAYLEERAREHADAGEAAQYLALDAAAQELKQHASQWLPEQPQVSWVFFSDGSTRPEGFFCKRCGHAFDITRHLPLEMWAFLGLVRAYMDEHRECEDMEAPCD